MDSEMYEPIAEGIASSASPSPASMSVDIAGTRDAGHARGQDLVALRRQRIKDYLEGKLHSALPEVSLLGAVSADLAALALRLTSALDEVLMECQDARDYLVTLPRGAEVLLKIARQIDRQSRLINELERGQVGAGQSARKMGQDGALEHGEKTRI